MQQLINVRSRWSRATRALIRRGDGQDLVEYTLLVAVVAVGAIVTLQRFQNVIGNVWTMIASNLSGGS
jgi:Flp pilus assembly pilin Flp